MGTVVVIVAVLAAVVGLVVPDQKISSWSLISLRCRREFHEFVW